MGPFIARPRERIVDHDEPEPSTDEHSARMEPDGSIYCTTCNWGSMYTNGRALREWRVHRAAMILERLDAQVRWDDEVDW